MFRRNGDENAAPTTVTEIPTEEIGGRTGDDE
jgi:hypothetical protein